MIAWPSPAELEGVGGAYLHCPRGLVHVDGPLVTLAFR
jgi:hypothetical protein